MGAELRKNKDTLVVTGTGVIAFGAWNVLKTVMLLVSNRELFEASFEEEQKELGMTLVWIILGGFMLVAFGFNLYVGLAARSEGMGKKKRKYRVLACLMLITHFMTAVFSVMGIFVEDEIDDEILVSTLIDVLGFFMLLDLVIAAFKVRRRMKEEEAMAAERKAG
jgi:hypothetical protein